MVFAFLLLALSSCFVSGSPLAWTPTPGPSPTPRPHREPPKLPDTAICTQELTAQLWIDAGVDQYLSEVVAELVRADNNTNLVQAMQDATGILNWDCDATKSCETAVLTNNLLHCLRSPKSVAVMLAMAHFSEYFHSILSQAQSEANYLTSQAGNMVEQFLLTPEQVEIQDNPAEAASTALMVIGGILSIIPGLGSIIDDTIVTASKIAQALTKIGGAIAKEYAGDGAVVPDEPNFTAFANISSAMGNTTEAMSQFIPAFINNALLTVPSGSAPDFTTDPQMLPSLLQNGIFASSSSAQSPNEQDKLRATFASASINNLYQTSQVVVVKASSASLGFNPCDGSDLLFSTDFKYCDSDGNMWVLQQWPAFVEMSFTDTSHTVPPGFSSLANYGLGTQAIALAAYNTQSASQAFSAPAPSDPSTSSTLQNLDFGNLQPQDLVFFNLPVCDLDLQTSSYSSDAAEICSKGSYEGVDEQTCGFFTRMYCSCPPMVLNGTQWPYNTNPPDAMGRDMCSYDWLLDGEKPSSGDGGDGGSSPPPDNPRPPLGGGRSPGIDR